VSNIHLVLSFRVTIYLRTVFTASLNYDTNYSNNKRQWRMEQVAAAKIVLSATGVEQNTLRYILV
jgi:hypothetical protein